MEKTYPVSEETAEMFLEYVANSDCRDACVKSVFKTKRAVKYGKNAERARLEFWEMVKETYPELKDESLKYDRAQQALSIITEESK